MLDFGKLNFSVSFNPTTAFPLDARSYFDSYSTALAAAQSAEEVGSSNTTYYYGQTLVVVENSEATLYSIQPDNTLRAVGSATLGDDKSIEVIDGKVSLFGFGEAEEGQQLRIQNGKIEWFTPDTTTVEGLSSTVAGHTSDITNLKSRVTAVEADIDTLTGTGEGSIKESVDNAINDFATNLSDDNIVNTFKELVDYVAEHGTEATDMAADILSNSQAVTALQELVGDTNVSTQILNAIDEALSVEGADKYALASELAAAVTRISTAEGKISSLESTVSNVEAGAQVNVIDDVSDEFSISEDKTLSLAAITMDKVTGLPNALLNKVDAIDGKGLSTNDFTDALKERLESINDGEVNIIESVLINGSPLQINDKAVEIPAATQITLGVVKSTDAENGISVAEDGSMSVNSINMTKIVQTDGDRLILDGGNSSNG